MVKIEPGPPRRVDPWKEIDMTDPREPPTKEAQLPDALDQTPEAHPAQGTGMEHGSEDAQMAAHAGEGDGDVERAGPA
jgi:hypothetical protein